MTVLRLDNIGIVVDDLPAAVAFFVELGLTVEGEATVEGELVGRLVGLEDVRSDIVMMKTPDGHGRLELSKFHHPAAVAGTHNAPVNTFGIGRIMFAVDDIDAVVARLQARGRGAGWRDRPVRKQPPALLPSGAGGRPRRAGAAAREWLMVRR